MNKYSKTKFFLFLTLLFIFIFPLLIVSAAPNLKYEPMETLPGFTKTNDFITFISNLYKFGIWTVGICALIMIVIGGYMYAASGGNNASMEKAKSFITDALVGLILALLAYLILYVINPELVKIKMAAATPVSFPANCTGTIPDNSTLCTSTNPTASTAISLVATCASAPCTYGCNTSYALSGGKCIATTPPPSTGLTPAEKQACEKTSSQVPGQCADASTSLNTLINCVNKELEKVNKKVQISSISDGNGGLNCYKNNPWPQCTAGKQTYCCFHKKGSCHYGGTSGGASCAVDYSTKGSTASNAEISQAVSSCGGNAINEGNHVHASASGCGCT